MQTGDKVLDFKIRLKLHEDRLVLWFKVSYLPVFREDRLSALVPTLPYTFYYDFTLCPCHQCTSSKGRWCNAFFEVTSAYHWENSHLHWEILSMHGTEGGWDRLRIDLKSNAMSTLKILCQGTLFFFLFFFCSDECTSLRKFTSTLRNC